jgi:hypothetical protein
MRAVRSISILPCLSIRQKNTVVLKGLPTCQFLLTSCWQNARCNRNCLLAVFRPVACYFCRRRVYCSHFGSFGRGCSNSLSKGQALLPILATLVSRGCSATSESALTLWSLCHQFQNNGGALTLRLRLVLFYPAVKVRSGWTGFAMKAACILICTLPLFRLRKIDHLAFGRIDFVAQILSKQSFTVDYGIGCRCWR